MRLGFVLVLLLASHASAQSWVGVDVVTKYRVPLKVGNRIVDEDSTHRIFHVAQVKDSWLWLESGSISGWVQSNDVVPYSQAIDFYTKEIAAGRGALAHICRGLLRQDRGEYDMAIADYNEAIRLDPMNAWAYCNRGNTWSSKTDYDKAIADYNEAARLNTKCSFAYGGRGYAWSHKKNDDKAIADFSETIRLDPKNAWAYCCRGLTWNQKKNYEKAIADYNEAIRLNPKHAKAYMTLASLLANCPDERYRDGKRAAEFATKGCELSDWKVWYYVGTLAAAYAESGDYTNAVKYGEQALSLAPVCVSKVIAVELAVPERGRFGLRKKSPQRA